jgi:predicted lipoprotein with Yx(FWY)xxD motif
VTSATCSSIELAGREALMTVLRFRSGVVAGLALALTLAAAGCASTGGGSGASPPTAGTAGANAGALVIGSGVSGTLGPFLTGPTGLTLYVKDGDSATSSTCTGGCATSWPPLKTTAGQPVSAGPGITGAFGTLTRDDGSLQVTYNGLPLYTWVQDTKKGDATGDGIAGFHVALVSAPSGSPAPSSTAGRYGY